MLLISSFIAGLIFGLGLTLSGMTNPAKVIGFLDVTGKWDPSLVFVMFGAISVSFFAFRIAKKREYSLLGAKISLPTTQDIDVKLIAGASVFGSGWAIAGYCPGPAIASLLTSSKDAGTFVLAMLVGMAIFEVIQKITTKST